MYRQNNNADVHLSLKSQCSKCGHEHTGTFFLPMFILIVPHTLPMVWFLLVIMTEMTSDAGIAAVLRRHLPPGNAPPSAHSLVSLGNDDGDDQRCQHSSRDEKASAKDQHGFVFEHPLARRAGLPLLMCPAILRGVVRGEATPVDDLSVDSEGGLGSGLVLCGSEEAKLGHISILQLPHVETLHIDSI